MIDRNFKCKCKLLIQNKEFNQLQKQIHEDMRSVKREIYNHGIRDHIYTVLQINREGEILNIYQLKYTPQGTIFQKQTYSAWKEMKARALKLQLNIFE